MQLTGKRLAIWSGFPRCNGRTPSDSASKRSPPHLRQPSADRLAGQTVCSDARCKQAPNIDPQLDHSMRLICVFMCIYCAGSIWRFAMTQAQLTHTAMVSGFVDSLQEPRTPYISPSRLSKALGVKVANLAQLT